MRKYLMFVLFSVHCFYLHAQQEAQYTQFMYNNLLINPGYTGARRVASANILYRNQWAGFKGNPQSYLASFDLPLPKAKKLGVGFIVSNQSEGVMGRMTMTPSVSYAVIHTDNTTFRVGINSSFRQYRFDLERSNLFIRNRQDPNLGESAQPAISNMNIGAGIYLDKNNFYAGLSIPNLNENPLILSQIATEESTGKELRHIYFALGGIIPIAKNMDFKPALLVKYVKNAPLSIDANASILINKKIMGGVSYRLNNGAGDSIDFLAFIQINNNLGVGMAYDFGLSQIGNYYRNSLEFLARYDISVTQKSVHNPRFFF
jgi:type IX secretion system PorP/SprF family membrane protein